jgi:hypothetical protein
MDLRYLVAAAIKGDRKGHLFRGNQYSSATAGDGGSTKNKTVNSASLLFQSGRGSEGAWMVRDIPDSDLPPSMRTRRQAIVERAKKLVGKIEVPYKSVGQATGKPGAFASQKISTREDVENAIAENLRALPQNKFKVEDAAAAAAKIGEAIEWETNVVDNDNNEHPWREHFNPDGQPEGYLERLTGVYAMAFLRKR